MALSSLRPSEILPCTNQDVVTIFPVSKLRPKTSSKKHGLTVKEGSPSVSKGKTAGCTRHNHQEMLEQVFQSISAQSEELSYSERVWKAASTKKHLAHQCVNKNGRSATVSDGKPTVQKAKDWADDKNFWMSYLPRQRRIWNYESGNGGYWETYCDDPKDAELILELQKDNVTGEPISFYERCKRHQKRVEWEEMLMDEFDTKQRKDRLKNRELTLTMNRYKDFSKNLMDNLKDVQENTKNLDALNSRSNRRYRQTEMERLEEGYKALKSIYDINPDLVEGLAEQHINGPPGKRWMGLSRDDVKQVIKILERTHTDLSYCPFPVMTKRSPGEDACTPRVVPDSSLLRYGSSRSHLLSSMSRHDVRTPQGRLCCTPRTPHEPQPKPQVILRNRVKGRENRKKPLKPAQLMPLHIPGPDFLRQNVVIRAFSADLDGRPEYDLDIGASPTGLGPCNANSAKKGIHKKKRSRPCTMPSSVVGAGEDEDECASGALSLKENMNQGSKTDGEIESEEEGITIESFIPSYMVTR